MSAKKGILQNLASLGIIQIANLVMPLISVPIISRIIGPEKFGAISYAAVFVSYFNLFIGYGFNLTAIRRLSADFTNKKLRNLVFSEVLFCQLILFLITILVFIVLLFTIPNLQSDKKLAIYSMLFCISSVLTQNWLFQAMQDLSKVAVINLLGKFIYLFSILSLITTKNDYYWQPLILSVSQIIVSLISFFWAKKKYEIEFVYVSFKRCIELLWKEKSVYMTIMLTSFYTAANIIVLGFFENKAEIGFFTAGQKLIVVAQTVITLPLSQVFYPIISKSFSESKGKGVYQVQRLVPIVLLFTGVLGVVILLFGPRILLMFYGTDFSPATSNFKILAFIPLLIAINNIMGVQVMLNYNMDFKYFKAIFIGTVFSLLGNLFLIHFCGTIGTSINWVATEVFITIMLYFSIRKKGINIFNVNFFKFNFICGEISSFLIKTRANPNRKS